MTIIDELRLLTKEALEAKMAKECPELALVLGECHKSAAEGKSTHVYETSNGHIQWYLRDLGFNVSWRKTWE